MAGPVNAGRVTNLHEEKDVLKGDVVDQATRNDLNLLLGMVRKQMEAVDPSVREMSNREFVKHCRQLGLWLKDNEQKIATARLALAFLDERRHLLGHCEDCKGFEAYAEDLRRGLEEEFGGKVGVEIFAIGPRGPVRRIASSETPQKEVPDPRMRP